MAMDQHIKGGRREGGDSLSMRSPAEKTRGDGDKLLLGTSPLDPRRRYFPMRRVGHWDHLPGQQWSLLRCS